MFLAFAAAFLLNLLRPKFVHLLSEQHANSIVSLIEQLIRVLNEAAIDETHMARSYAKFLSSLLDKHRLVQEGGTIGTHGTSGGVQYDPSVQGFLSQYSHYTDPPMSGPERQGSHSMGPNIHITGPQDMLEPIYRADTNSSASSAEPPIRHSDLWPPPFASFSDCGMGINGECAIRIPLEHEVAWRTAGEPNTRPPVLHAQP